MALRPASSSRVKNGMPFQTFTAMTLPIAMLRIREPAERLVDDAEALQDRVEAAEQRIVDALPGQRGDDLGHDPGQQHDRRQQVPRAAAWLWRIIAIVMPVTNLIDSDQNVKLIVFLSASR